MEAAYVFKLPRTVVFILNVLCISEKKVGFLQYFFFFLQFLQYCVESLSQMNGGIVLFVNGKLGG